MSESNPQDERVAKMKAASTHAVERVKNKIRLHFNLQGKHCTCGTLESLIRALGLSQADREALIDEIKKQGFKVPR